jgi:hypothetical protein
MLRTVRILEVRPKSRMFVIGPSALAMVMIFVLVGRRDSPIRWLAPFLLAFSLLYITWGLWPGPRRP